MDRPVGEPCGEHQRELARELGFGRPLGIALALRDVLAFRAPEPQEDRHAHGPLQERRLDIDAGGDPVVAPRDSAAGAVGGRVVMPEAPEHLTAAALGQRVVDRHDQRLPRGHQARDEQLREPQPELIRRPAGVAEEPVRAGVMPDPRQPAAGQHPAHGPLAGL